MNYGNSFKAHDATANTLELRSAVNDYVSKTFPTHRKYISHSHPEYSPEKEAWIVLLGTKKVNGHSVQLGRLLVGGDGQVIKGVSQSRIIAKIEKLLVRVDDEDDRERLQGEGLDFRFGDGIYGVRALENESIDLLLTDPPYGISKPYSCENQVPRRLRKDGRDFIMPKGDFGNWDKAIEPSEWLDVALPKVRGWFVSFCGQTQIGEYSQCLLDHKFLAVGAMVWQKTNPVPFNHKYKPINAWEAIVVGKRPGTKFNGETVHNVFICKSPSPSERIHPTQKPVSLISGFVKLFSDRGDLVCDPFAGSATTVLASLSTGRRVLAFEQDWDIYQKAKQRIQNSYEELCSD